MIRSIASVFLVLLMVVAVAFPFGKGSDTMPDGDTLNVISHSLDLPPGFAIGTQSQLPTISTDYGTRFTNPVKFELPTRIMTKGLLPKERMISFLWLYNDKMEITQVEKIVELYIKESAIEGVNHDIAFVQMLLETGYLKFGGDVKKDQNNFCGLGAIGNGVPGLSFFTVEDGVRAHIQHLKAYASTDSLNTKKVDDRFGRIRRGTATEIKHLTGKWATDPLYHLKLEKLIQLVFEGYIPPKKSTFVMFD